MAWERTMAWELLNAAEHGSTAEVISLLDGGAVNVDATDPVNYHFRVYEL